MGPNQQRFHSKTSIAKTPEEEDNKNLTKGLEPRQGGVLKQNGWQALSTPALAHILKKPLKAPFNPPVGLCYTEVGEL